MAAPLRSMRRVPMKLRVPAPVILLEVLLAVGFTVTAPPVPTTSVPAVMVVFPV